jgi:hypothetical protein
MVITNVCPTQSLAHADEDRTVILCGVVMA